MVYNNTERFALGGMIFEYDLDKNDRNIKKHGISLKNAAHVFFDYDRIELYDEAHSDFEDRYNTIGDVSVGNTIIGNIGNQVGQINDILFVVYTERCAVVSEGEMTDVIRLISARMATNFERGLYYGKYN